MSVVVTRLSKHFGAQKAVNAIDFSIEKGEVVGFLGPNGAGKSTTMKMITGYFPSTPGMVSVCDERMDTDNIALRKKIGYLPEHNPLYKEMYVKEYLNFVCSIYQIKNASNKVDELIELTGLTPEKHKQINQLSKGYRQRVGLAQAMLHDPEVLVLDEPTSGLDPNQLVDIRALIKNLGKEKTVILSTHIMQEVEAICDRVIIINKGEIVADEKTEILKEKSGKQKIYELELLNNCSKDILINALNEQQIETFDNKRFTIKSHKKGDLRTEIFDFAVNQNNPILTLQLKQQNLESVFRELTGE